MDHRRLTALSDAIFAIAMTLLVFQIHVPVITHPSTHTLWQALFGLRSTFLSFILSFAVLFIYWRSHNFIISSLARNVDVKLANLNALFLFFIVFLPFSAQFLANYYKQELAVGLYGLNVIVLSILLILMRRHILKAKHIENNPTWTEEDLLNSSIRTMVPPVSAVLAIIVGFWNEEVSLLIFTIAVVLSFSGYTTTLVKKLIRK